MGLNLLHHCRCSWSLRLHRHRGRCRNNCKVAFLLVHSDLRPVHHSGADRRRNPALVARRRAHPWLRSIVPAAFGRALEIQVALPHLGRCGQAYQPAFGKSASDKEPRVHSQRRPVVEQRRCRRVDLLPEDSVVMFESRYTVQCPSRAEPRANHICECTCNWKDHAVGPVATPLNTAAESYSSNLGFSLRWCFTGLAKAYAQATSRCLSPTDETAAVMRFRKQCQGYVVCLFSAARATSPILFIVFSSLATAQTPSPEATTAPDVGLEKLWWLALLIVVVAACRGFVKWASGPDHLQSLYASNPMMEKSSQGFDAGMSACPPKIRSRSSVLRHNIQPHEIA